MLREERWSVWLLIGALLLMLVGFVRAQDLTQGEINMQQQERVAALTERVRSLEQNQTYGLGALAANLAAHLLQIKASRRR